MRITAFFVCLCLTMTQAAEAKDYLVYYLGGQSNMDGHGYVKDLPDELNQPVEGVMIFHGNIGRDAQPVDGRGVWDVLKPGHGAGFKADEQAGALSNRVGLELTFGLAMQQAMPDKNIALIKYSKGGTSIDEAAARNFGCWEPDFEGGEGEGQGVNQYDHFLATIRNAMAVSDIDGDGEADRLIPAGILWMQGESDASDAEVAERYEANLKRLMDLIRAALREDDLPVVVGRISDSGNSSSGKVWEYGDVVRAAQASFVEKDAAAALVTSTDEYGYSDPWHYDTVGYIDLGRQFAALMLELSK